MAAVTSSTWKTIGVIAGVALVIALIFTGYAVWGVAILILLLVLGGGALLYRRAGPPER